MGIADGSLPLDGDAAGARHAYLSYSPCGFCGQGCSKARMWMPIARALKARPRIGAQVHLIELAEENARLLRTIVNAGGLQSHISVHNLAMSNETGRTPAVHVTLGQENRGIKVVDVKAALDHHKMDNTRQATLDEFLSQNGIRQIVDVVKVDTEGHDALVIEGMRKALRQRRVTFLEFEYHSKGLR